MNGPAARNGIHSNWLPNAHTHILQQSCCAYRAQHKKHSCMLLKLETRLGGDFPRGWHAVTRGADKEYLTGQTVSGEKLSPEPYRILVETKENTVANIAQGRQIFKRERNKSHLNWF